MISRNSRQSSSSRALKAGQRALQGPRMAPGGRQGLRARRDAGPALAPEKKPPTTVSAPEGPLTPARRASARMLSSLEAAAPEKNTPTMQEVVENAVYFAGKLGQARVG